MKGRIEHGSRISCRRAAGVTLALAAAVVLGLPARALAADSAGAGYSYNSGTGVLELRFFITPGSSTVDSINIAVPFATTVSSQPSGGVCGSSSCPEPGESGSYTAHGGTATFSPPAQTNAGEYGYLDMHVSQDPGSAAVQFNYHNGDSTATTATQCGALSATPATLPAAQVGTAYSQQLTGQGGAAPYSFGLQGVLPAGITLSSDGLFSGTPGSGSDGTYTGSELIVDGNGCSGTQGYQLTIDPASGGGGGGTGGGSGGTTPMCPGHPEGPSPCADLTVGGLLPNAVTPLAFGTVLMPSVSFTNNGPDSAGGVTVSISESGRDQSGIPYGPYKLYKNNLGAVGPGYQEGVGISGGALLSRAGDVKFSADVTSSTWDPVPFNNHTERDYAVYPEPVSIASLKSPVIHTESLTLTGTADTCGEAHTPQPCMTQNLICEHTAGCIDAHHDQCLLGSGTIGVCTSQPACNLATGLCCPAPTTAGCPNRAGDPMAASSPDKPVAADSFEPAAASAAPPVFRPSLEQIGRVRVALVHLAAAKRGSRGSTCQWLERSGKLRRGACNRPLWVTAKGTSSWRLQVGRLLPGDWLEYVQAANRAGFSQSTFSARDGNRLAFHVA